MVSLNEGPRRWTHGTIFPMLRIVSITYSFGHAGQTAKTLKARPLSSESDHNTRVRTRIWPWLSEKQS